MKYNPGQKNLTPFSIQNPPLSYQKWPLTVINFMPPPPFYDPFLTFFMTLFDIKRTTNLSNYTISVNKQEWTLHFQATFYGKPMHTFRSWTPFCLAFQWNCKGTRALETILWMKTEQIVNCKWSRIPEAWNILQRNQKKVFCISWATTYYTT